MTALGFRGEVLDLEVEFGEVLDLEVEFARPRKVIEEESKLVDEMLQTNAMSSTGRLFKIGVQIANAAVVTKAGKKQIQLNEQKKAEMEKKLSKREINIKMEAIEAFRRYCKAGKQGTAPKTAKDAKLILRFVLPILALDDKLSSYNTGAKAIERLGQFQADPNSKTLWDIEMEKHIKNDDENLDSQI